MESVAAVDRCSVRMVTALRPGHTITGRAELVGRLISQPLTAMQTLEQGVVSLKYLENGTVRRGRDDRSVAYDLSWMWEELGIANLCR